MSFKHLRALERKSELERHRRLVALRSSRSQTSTPAKMKAPNQMNHAPVTQDEVDALIANHERRHYLPEMERQMGLSSASTEPRMFANNLFAVPVLTPEQARKLLASRGAK